MSDLPNLQQEMAEVQGDHTIEQAQPVSTPRAENAATAQPSVAETVTLQQEFGHISAPFGDVVNPNAPRVIEQTQAGPSGKAFIFGSPIAGNQIAKTGPHNAPTWAGVQEATLAA